MKTWTTLLLFTVLISTMARAGTGPYSLGVMIGDPTGISGKYDLPKNQAIDAGLTWSQGSRGGTEIHGDLLQILPGHVSAGETDLDLYYGIGARMIMINGGDDKNKIALGPRAPLGLLHQLKDPSVEFFGELALILDLIPGIRADIDLGVGARYRF